MTKTPAEEVEFSWEKKPAFAGDTAQLTWKPRSLKAIVVVRNAEGEVRYSTFDFSDPQFGGDKWARLGSNGRLALGVDVFSEPGEYQVLKFGVTKNWRLIPRCRRIWGFSPDSWQVHVRNFETLEIHE